MKKKNRDRAAQRTAPGRRPKVTIHDLPFERSIGYQVRATHRALQRYLQIKIEPFGITTGAWYFLRALWHEDGLTQRELAQRIGTAEPTALIAIKAMESQGLVRRVRNRDDRRKLHIRLTAKGRGLKGRLIPLAREVVGTAATALSPMQLDELLHSLMQIQGSLNLAIGRVEGGKPSA
jgi:DNA-binding MarR family transcriptional regulator